MLGMLFIVVTNLFNITHPIIVKEAVDHLESIGRSIPDFRESADAQVVAEPETLALVMGWFGFETERTINDLEMTSTATSKGISIAMAPSILSISLSKPSGLAKRHPACPRPCPNLVSLHWYVLLVSVFWSCGDEVHSVAK